MTDAHPTPLTIGDTTFCWGSRTYVMGIVNVTPDSFSGDGTGYDVPAAVARAVLWDHSVSSAGLAASYKTGG